MLYDKMSLQELLIASVLGAQLTEVDYLSIATSKVVIYICFNMSTGRRLGQSETGIS